MPRSVPAKPPKNPGKESRQDQEENPSAPSFWSVAPSSEARIFLGSFWLRLSGVSAAGLGCCLLGPGPRSKMARRIRVPFVWPRFLFACLFSWIYVLVSCLFCSCRLFSPIFSISNVSLGVGCHRIERCARRSSLFELLPNPIELGATYIATLAGSTLKRGWFCL